MSCFLTILGLMAVAALLGYLIGRIFGKKSVTNTETVVDNSAANSLRAELNSLKGKYSSLEKEHSSLNTQYLSLQGSASGSANADAALQARIKQLEGQISNLKASAGSGRSDAAAERKRKQEALLASLSAQRGVIDLGRIGSGGPDDKDNLKRLPGLGALLEKKLNALGIYKFLQIANLTEGDQAKLNGLLDLPKDKFQKSGWVLESKRQAGLISEEDLILTRVKGRKSWLNYDRIGLASVADKDDLQKINGIGPFIEDKLNALEIYTFQQLSKLTNRDVALVNDAIELTEGHMDRDDWVGQAKGFLKKK
ncbi:MAG: hypothetical protein R8P61_10700 [Bacteroidia bacterium]|nr:hypothetical protein [Bacteroidia bacterium]